MRKVNSRFAGYQLILPVFLLLLCPALGVADSAGIQSFTNPVVWPNSDNEDWSLGWEFAVNGSVTIDALGYNYFGVPLNNNHDVGVFNSSGTLLGSVTVSNASTLFNGYLYTSLGAPLVLGSGDYWIAGTTLGLNDGWIYQADNIVTAASITYLESWFTAGNGGVLSFPSTDASGRQYLPVNFTIPSGTTTPEPGTAALLATALLGIGLLAHHIKQG